MTHEFILVDTCGDGPLKTGRITLTRDRREWRIEIAWLTGEVRIEEDR